MQNLENLDVFEILITQSLLECPKDPLVRSALIFFLSKDSLLSLNDSAFHVLFRNMLMSSLDNCLFKTVLLELIANL